LDTQAEIDACRLRLTNNKGAGGPDDVFVDAIRLEIYKAGSPNYDLDLEVGWTAADYDETNEYLCIYGGTQGAEALRVDVWSGSWTNVITDLQTGWNNVSVSSYLTGAAFEIRFTDTSDEATLADEWQVEGVLLHVWSAAPNYRLELEEAWTSANYTRANEYVCIKTGAFSGEALWLQIWNTTASDWDNLSLSLTASAWNNFSVSDYLTTANLYIRFVDNTQVDDTSSQDTWQKDCTVLRTWAGAAELSVTVNELIGIADSTELAADYHLSISELIPLAESVSVGVIYMIVILEIISLAAFASTTLIAGINIFESIGLGVVTTTTMNLSTTINEVINL